MSLASIGLLGFGGCVTTEAAQTDAAPLADARSGTDGGALVVCEEDPAEQPWVAHDAPVMAAELLETTEVRVGRSARFAITALQCPGDLAGRWSYGFTLENEYVIIDALTWRSRPDCTEPELVERVFPILFPYAGTWTVMADQSAAVEVVAADYPCIPDPGHQCAQDVECGGGQRCLSDAAGIQRCDRLCEFDRDCGGDGICGQDESLSGICISGTAECSADRPCPCGFACQDGSCQPEFQLSSQTRHACETDSDCTAPMRCVESQGEIGLRRTCEIACPSHQDVWCSGPHSCDPAASVESQPGICGWVGD